MLRVPPLGRVLFGLVGALLLSCATMQKPVATPVVLWFEEFNEVLQGTATQRGSFLGSDLDVRGRVGKVRCVGESRARIVPPTADPPHRCDGMRGEARLTCSDGRRLALEWESEEACRIGYGRGVDAEGHAFRLIYGGDRERARMVVREAMADLSGKPRLPEIGKKSEGMSTGTGFFVSWDGHVVTNHHVIREAKLIKVRLDGDLVNAKLVDSDEKHDVALLQVEAIRRPLPVRRFNELEKGQEVFTLGYPLVILQGQEQKATFGRVNALSGLQGDEVFAQIDVPIQPGNSGGPLLTSKGEVAGIVTSMLHPMATYQIAGVLPQNVNYAVKSDHIYSLIASNLREGWNKKVGGGKRKQITALIESLEGSVVLIAAY
jgi:S1-C subfamily serine protease